MIPVLYEIKRALSTKTMIVLTAVIVLFSVGIAYGTAIGSQGTSPANQTSSYAYGYGINGTYSIVTYEVNGYGQPIQGSTVNIGVGNGVTGTTDAHGYANFTLTNVSISTLPKGGVNVSFVPYNYTTNTGQSDNSMAVYELNQTNPYFFIESSSGVVGNKTDQAYANNPRYELSQVSIPNSGGRGGVSIFYEGFGNQAAQAIKLYYLPINSSSGPQVNTPSPGLSEQNMTYYGTYSNFSHIIINPSGISGSNQNVYEFAVFAANGSPNATSNGTLISANPVAIAPSTTGSEVTTFFFTGEMDMLGIFVPLMAAVSAYITYGKDRTGSVLESILVRPITRVGLMSSRYLANTAAVFIAVLISFGGSSLVFDHYLGAFLPLDTFLAGLWAILVGIAGFVGLVYLASVFVKSQGALLGFAIAIFFVLDLFWSYIAIIPGLILAEVLKFTPGTLVYAKAYIDLLYITPTGFPSLARMILSGSVPFGINIRGVTLASLGLSYPVLVTIGVIWIAVPLALAVYAFTRTD